MVGATGYDHHALRDSHAANALAADVECYRQFFGRLEGDRSRERLLRKARLPGKHRPVGHKGHKAPHGKFLQNGTTGIQHLETFLHARKDFGSAVKACRKQVRERHGQNFSRQFRLDLAALAGEPHRKACPEHAVIHPEGVSHQHFRPGNLHLDGGVLFGKAFCNVLAEPAEQIVRNGQAALEGAAPLPAVAEGLQGGGHQNPRCRRKGVALHVQKLQRKVAEIPGLVGEGAVQAVTFPVKDADFLVEGFHG